MKVVYECTECNNKITFQFIIEFTKFDCFKYTVIYST